MAQHWRDWIDLEFLRLTVRHTIASAGLILSFMALRWFVLLLGPSGSVFTHAVELAEQTGFLGVFVLLIYNLLAEVWNRRTRLLRSNAPNSFVAIAW